MDLATRMIVGWSINKNPDAQLAVNALEMGRARGYVAQNAIFHSDRAVQYTSNVLAAYAKEHNIRLSVGRTGVC